MIKKTKTETVKTVKKLPKGWKVVKGTPTQPRGTVLISNGKSLFDKVHKNYEQKLLIVDKAAYEKSQRAKQKKVAAPKKTAMVKAKPTPKKKPAVKKTVSARVKVDHDTGWEHGDLTGDSARFNKFLRIARNGKSTVACRNELKKIGLNEKGIGAVWNSASIYGCNVKEMDRELMSIFNNPKYRADSTNKVTPQCKVTPKRTVRKTATKKKVAPQRKTNKRTKK